MNARECNELLARIVRETAERYLWIDCKLQWEGRLCEEAHRLETYCGIGTYNTPG